jgi:hypothetical protein
LHSFFSIFSPSFPAVFSRTPSHTTLAHYVWQGASRENQACETRANDWRGASLRVRGRQWTANEAATVIVLLAAIYIRGGL